MTHASHAEFIAAVRKLSSEILMLLECSRPCRLPRGPGYTWQCVNLYVVSYMYVGAEYFGRRTYMHVLAWNCTHVHLIACFSYWPLIHSSILDYLYKISSNKCPSPI